MKKSDIAIYISAVLTLILTTFVVFSTQNVTYDDKKMNDILTKNTPANATNDGLIGDSGDKSSTSPMFENKVSKKSSDDDKQLLSDLDTKKPAAKKDTVTSSDTTMAGKKSFADINSLDVLAKSSPRKKAPAVKKTVKRKTAAKRVVRKKRNITRARRTYKKTFSSTNSAGSRFHVVKYGDTMWKIAARYGTTTIRVIRANSLANPNVLYPGMKIRLPS